MVTLGSLLLPILIAAVLVFIVSSIVWMVLPHHKTDYGALPDEEAVCGALGEGLAPGQYDFPHMTSMEELKTPAVQERFEKGPAGFVTIAPRGMPNMGKNLGIWFVYTVVVSVIVAYVTGRGLGPGTEYMRVFAVASTTAWAAYGLATVSESVWFHRPWSSTLKQLFDALLYASVTGGAMAGFWP